MNSEWSTILLILGIIGVLLGGLWVADKVFNQTSGGTDGSITDPKTATLVLGVNPKEFNPNQGGKTTISLQSDTKTIVEVFVAGQVENSSQKSIQQITLENGKKISFDWDGKIQGEPLQPGNYRIIVREVEDGGDRKETDVTINGLIEGLNRNALKQQYPWPSEIRIGLTETKPVMKLTTKIVNPGEVPGEISAISNFFPRPTSVTAEGFFENGKISFNTTQDLQTIEPYTLEITIDYSEYFNNPIIKQKSLEGEIIVTQGGLYPNPVPIPFKINLNESGAILYNNEKDADISDYLTQLAEEKGWGLIGVGGESPGNVLDVKREILNEYKISNPPLEPTIGPFKNLLIIGWHDSIPMYDETGILGKNDEGEFDDERILDHVFYGDMDGDPFIELSVGRIPITNVEGLEAYFEAAGNRQPAEEKYIYVTGSEEHIYRPKDVEEFEGKNLNNSQLKYAFMRKQFLYTGYGPSLDVPNGFPFENVPKGFKVFDDFSNCYRDATSFTFAFHRACDPSTGNFSSGQNLIVYAKSEQEDETTLENYNKTIKSYIYSTLAQKTPGQFKAGESFKDYLNLAMASEYNEAEKYYILYGDPSNIIRTSGAFFNASKRVKMDLEGEQIKLSMPKLNLNDFFFLGKDKPFTEAEIKSIQEGKFAIADATVLEKDSPFVIEAQKSTDITKYDIVLDENPDSEIGNNESTIWASELTESKKIQVMPSPKPTHVNHDFDLSQFNRLFLEATQNNGGVIELLEAPIESSTVTEQEIEGKKYQVNTFILKNTERYPNFLGSSGTVKLTQNQNNEVRILVELEGIEKTRALSLSESKLLFFDSYKLYFENSKTKEKKLINTIEKQVQRYGPISFGMFPIQIDLSKYDTVSIYSVSGLQKFDFLEKPILVANINDSENHTILDKEVVFENKYGFLQYPLSKLEVKIFTPKEPTANGNLFQITRVENLKPLKENKIILLEIPDNSQNKDILLNHPSIVETVKTILDDNPSLKEKFTSRENVLLLDGDWKKGFFGHFVEGAYFFGNQITAAPFLYPQNVDFESVKNAFESADLSNEKSEDKMFKALIGQNNLGVDADIYFSTADESFTDQDVRFYFQFDLEDLFTLVEKGASDTDLYTLVFDGFEEGFEKESIVELPPQVEDEDEIQPMSEITIHSVLIGGGKEVNKGETINLDEDGDKFINASVSVNVPFSHIILLGNDQLLAKIYPEELSENYQPGTILTLSSGQQDLTLNNITFNNEIHLVVRIYGEQPEDEINSTPFIFKTKGESFT